MRAGLRGPALDAAPGLRDYVERDYLSGRPRGPFWRVRRYMDSGGESRRGREAAELARFLEATERALDDIDALRGARRGGRG